MKKINKTSILSLLLALVLAVGLAGCGGKAEVDESSLPPEPELDISQLVFMNPLIPPEGSILRDDMPNLLPKIKEAYEQNDHTVGWLQLPNTTMDEPVVKHPDDTNNHSAYYLRRGFDRRKNDYGTYYVDYRNNITGTREGLSKNTIIYGHSFTDNIEGLKMDQMKKLRASAEFATENPYVYFSLGEENLLWEIFAVFDATVALHYNNPSPTDQEFLELISEATKRSYYTYDVQVSATDKILTLSTCTYNYAAYPNDYRYVVMARLVGPDEKVKETAALEENSDRKLPA